MKTARFLKADHDRVCDTSLQGTVEIDYARLVKIFGPPHTNGDGEKVDAEWVLTLRSGHVATIYNYKTGKNYNGKEGQEVEEITDWHIGGTVESVAKEVIAIINEGLNTPTNPRRTNMSDCLTELARELQIQAFTVPMFDVDQREQWRANCAQLLSALPPDERASQAMSFAMGLVVRGIASDVALHYLEGGE